MTNVKVFLVCGLAAIAACGKVALTPDASGGDGNDLDAPVDAPTTLVVSASPSSFNLHANDTRQTKITVTNGTGQATGVPSLQVSGLTLGTMTFSANTCTSGLAPGASCTAIGNLAATAAGQANFNVVATTNPGGNAMAPLTATILAACPAACGANGTVNCCASSVVPGNATGATLAGTTFFRSYDVGPDNTFPDMGNPATVSDFRLDTYEVTVGRFRAFVSAGKGTSTTAPAAGAGAHPNLANSGWDASWNGNLAADTMALKVAVQCDLAPTWTDTAGANESLPMNCISWYEAMAFCIWDGGYLPTEAEWNYAASGGSEQRAYPWSPSSSPGSTTIDCSYANYNINNPSGTFCVNGTVGAANRAGSESPKGDARWGQSDLGGNLSEWNLDWYASPYPAGTCNDCANLTAASNRVIRGGSLYVVAIGQRASYRQFNFGPPAGRARFAGVRCARTP